jgi:Tol biopolymer transport system component
MHFAKTTRLTSLQGKCLGATFSPDGERIAFSRELDGRSDIYLIHRDGSNLTRLTNGGRGQGEGAYFDPHFSPDGAHLVCVRGDAFYEEYSDLYLIDLQSGEGRQLTDSKTDSSPSFSPDGQHIICVSERPTLREQSSGVDIYRITIDGREQVRLTHTEFEKKRDMAWPPRNLHPCYSPDGNFIAFASSAHGPRGENRFEIYRMRPDGSESTRLTFTQGSSSYPLWHPDSRQIAFTSWSKAADPKKNKSDIYLVDADGSELRCLEESQTINWLGGFSPDGRFLAFDSNRSRAADNVQASWEICLMDLATGQVHQMTDNTVLDRNPIFSPDGTALLFNSERDGANELYCAKIQP